MCVCVCVMLVVCASRKKLSVKLDERHKLFTVEHSKKAPTRAERTCNNCTDELGQPASTRISKELQKGGHLFLFKA